MQGKTLRCEFCDKADFVHYSKLQRHKQIAHAPWFLGLFICVTCELKFETVNKLTTHVQSSNRHVANLKLQKGVIKDLKALQDDFITREREKGVSETALTQYREWASQEITTNLDLSSGLLDLGDTLRDLDQLDFNSNLTSLLNSMEQISEPGTPCQDEPGMQPPLVHPIAGMSDGGHLRFTNQATEEDQQRLASAAGVEAQTNPGEATPGNSMEGTEEYVPAPPTESVPLPPTYTPGAVQGAAVAGVVVPGRDFQPCALPKPPISARPLKRKGAPAGDAGQSKASPPPPREPSVAMQLAAFETKLLQRLDDLSAKVVSTAQAQTIDLKNALQDLDEKMDTTAQTITTYQQQLVGAIQMDIRPEYMCPDRHTAAVWGPVAHPHCVGPGGAGHVVVHEPVQLYGRY